MIQLEALTLGYGQQILLDHVSANLDGGGLIALLGRNGSGKSTLLRATAGLGTIKSGRILLAGKDLAELRPEELARTVSFVTTEKVRIPNLKCRDVVALGRAPYTNWVGRLQPQDREIVAKSLALLDMSAYAERTMDQMSDGECQRIMIARALAQDTPIILLDEPTSFLPNRYELGISLQKLAHEQNKCILFSTHELDIALTLCDSIALIDHPHLHYLPTRQMINSGHIERLFRNETITFDPKELRIRIR
mgnify:CR=1 FL=1